MIALCNLFVLFVCVFVFVAFSGYTKAKREGFAKLRLVPVDAESLVGLDSSFQNVRSDILTMRRRLKRALNDES